MAEQTTNQSSNLTPEERAEQVREALSLSSRGARHQIGVSIALITVIPLLALTYTLLIVTRNRCFA